MEEKPRELPPSPYADAKEFALRWRVSVRKVRTWISGGMPSVLLGDCRRIIVSDADRWLINGGGTPKRSSRTRRPT